MEDGKTCESQIHDGEAAAIMAFVGTCLNALMLQSGGDDNDNDKISS
jgi:hypothetical protein